MKQEHEEGAFEHECEKSSAVTRHRASKSSGILSKQDQCICEILGRTPLFL